jgi:hypothetical protein
VFVTNDIGFFKLSEANLSVTPFKELMVFVDNMHIATDALYFFVKADHTAIANVMTLANVKYELMTVSAETVVNIIQHLQPCTQEVKAFCNDPINTTIFHLMYTFYNVCLKNIQSAIASQPQPTISQPADLPSVEPIPSIDQLVDQWVETDASFDPIDAILMDLADEDVAIAHANFEALDDIDFFDCMNIDNQPLTDV